MDCCRPVPCHRRANAPRTSAPEPLVGNRGTRQAELLHATCFGGGKACPASGPELSRARPGWRGGRGTRPRWSEGSALPSCRREPIRPSWPMTNRASVGERVANTRRAMSASGAGIALMLAPRCRRVETPGCPSHRHGDRTRRWRRHASRDQVPESRLRHSHHHD